MTKKVVDFIGSVSHATMREQDVLPKCLDVLREYYPKAHDAIVDELTTDIGPDWHEKELSDDELYALSELCWGDAFDALNEITPPGHYFGAHQGDGSDYGFWVCEDAYGDDEESGLSEADVESVWKGLYDQVAELVGEANVADITDENFGLMFSVVRVVKRGVQDLDVQVELCDSDPYEGIPPDSPGGGYNVSVLITTIEGAIMGQFCPYNYSDKCWTQDRVELNARIELLLDALEEYLEQVRVVELE